MESGRRLYEILYQPYYKLLVQLQSMAGRPTFKCRKIVIEPAVDAFLGYVKSYKSCKHENDDQIPPQLSPLPPIPIGGLLGGDLVAPFLDRIMVFTQELTNVRK